MLISRMVKKGFKRKGKDIDSAGCVVPMIIIILLAAGVIHLLNTVTEPDPIPLLTQTNGLVQLVKLDDIAKYSSTLITPPEQVFESELHVIGVYTETNDLIPKNSVALVYARDGWRYVEIDFKPISIEEQLATTDGTKKEEIILSDDITGTFFARNFLPQCVESPNENFPGKCVIINQLFFPLNDLVVAISADGDHATTGEMIEIARSIISDSGNSELGQHEE